MKRTTGVKTFWLTVCAVGVLMAANQSWAADITNCAEVSAVTEADEDSQPNNMVGLTAAQDDEACAPVTVNIVYDFGDAPDSYKTTLAVGGAQHEVVPWLKLGASIDDEVDAAKPLGADADKDGIDEDGINISSLVVGQKNIKLQTTTPPVNTSGADAYLACWIDYDANGAFDPSEFGSVVVPNNNASLLDIAMPDVPLTTVVGDSYARCRLSNVALSNTEAAGTLSDTTGFADGEVEDYKVSFTAQPTFDLALMKRVKTPVPDATDPTLPVSLRVGDTVTFEITVINQGGVDASGIAVVDYIPAGLKLAASSETQWTVTGNTATLTKPIASLAANDSTTVEITFIVESTAALGNLEGAAEISAATGLDGSGNLLTDTDSTPDATNDDTAKDDVVSEDGKAAKANDEDDHDIAKITIVPKVDLELTKTIADDKGVTITEIQRGQTVVYTLSVVNKGPNVATGVVVKDVLPSTLMYLEPTTPNPASAYDAATRTLTWTVPGSLPADGSSTALAISAMVK